MYSPSRFLSRSLLANDPAWSVLFVLLILTGLGTLAQAEPPPPECPPQGAKHLARIWQENLDNLWFYDESGQRVIPAMDDEWVAVRFLHEIASEALPAPVLAFNQRFDQALTDIIHSPAQADLILYRFAPMQRRQALQALLGGEVPEVRYVLPALVYNGQTVIVTERIRVHWKSQVSPEQRRRLLQSVGAVNVVDELVGHHELVQIDLCQRAAWQAANLLAEDLLVVTATPEWLPAEAPVTIGFQLASAGALPGAAIPFRLDIRFSRHIKLEPGAVANLDLKPSGVYGNLFAIDYDTPLSAVDVRRSPIEIRGRLYLYASGQFELPAIPIYYQDTERGGNQVHRISTPPIAVRIAALVPEGAGDHHLQVPEPPPLPALAAPLAAAPPTAPLWRLILAGTLMTSGLILHLRRRRASRRSENPPAASTTPLQALRQTLAKAEKGGDALSLSELALAVRRFLVDGVASGKVPPGGGCEHFFHRLRPYLADPLYGQFYQVMQEVEHGLLRGAKEEERRAVLAQIESLLATLAAEPTTAAQGESPAVPGGD